MGKYMVRNGELEGRRFRLEPGAKITIGRELSDLNFPDKRMSRRHCALEAREDGDYVEDLGSTNGTWVNSQKVKESLLTPGDLVRVGFTEFEFLGIPVALPGAGPLLSSGQTIAFRPMDQLRAPPTEDRRRLRGKSRILAAKRAAMGQGPSDTKRALISAKGKFCEACGEAIFVKEGAPDEGMEVDGLYLCRMCALISEKQKELGQDYLPSYAKIVGGRLAGGAGGAQEGAPAAEAGEPVEVVEEEAVDLDDLLPGKAVDLKDILPGKAEGAEPSATAPFDASEIIGAAEDAARGPAGEEVPGEETERAGPDASLSADKQAAPPAPDRQAGPDAPKRPTESPSPTGPGEDAAAPPGEALPKEDDILAAVERAVAARDVADAAEREAENEPERPSDVDRDGADKGGAGPLASLSADRQATPAGARHEGAGKEEKAPDEGDGDGDGASASDEGGKALAGDGAPAPDEGEGA